MLWIGTENGGLNRFDPSTGRFTRYLHDPGSPQSHSSNSMWMKSIMEDKQGNLWVGTTSGLNRLNRERTAFTRFVHEPSNPASLSANNIGGVYVDRAGSFEPLAQSKGIAYRYALPLQPVWGLLDTDHLEKIITKLLTNAVKFTPAGGQVVFTATLAAAGAQSSCLTITVQDTGIGIAAEHLPHIFDCFYQADATATRTYEGAGIEPGPHQRAGGTTGRHQPARARDEFYGSSAFAANITPGNRFVKTKRMAGA